MTDKLNYTIINHQARADLNIGYSEYAVADIIYNFASKPGNGSWCTVSKEWIGNQFGLSKKRVSNIIGLLKKAGIIEGKKAIINKSQGEALRPTSIWYENAVINTKGGNFSGQEDEKVGTFRAKVGTFRDKGGNFSGTKPGYNKEINNENNNNPPSPLPPKCAEKELQPAEKSNTIGYNGILEHFVTCSGDKVRMTDKKREQIRARLKMFTEEEIKKAISNTYQDRFYSGHNDRKWRADFNYIFRNDDNMEKLINMKPRRENARIFVQK